MKVAQHRSTTLLNTAKPQYPNSKWGWTPRSKDIGKCVPV